MTGEALPEALAIAALHGEGVRAWHEEPSFAERLAAQVNDPLLALVSRQHLVNTRLWHEEDEVRRTDVPDRAIVEGKRRIDRLNQERNDLIEKIDETLMGRLPAPDLSAPLHSETPGAIIDRLSILALKEYHMEEESRREDAPESHRQACRRRLAVLAEQRADLAGCLDELLAAILRGERRVRLYRQFKMYNDPATNPALRGQAAR